MDHTYTSNAPSPTQGEWSEPSTADLDSLAATYAASTPVAQMKPGERRQVAILFLELQDLLSWHEVMKASEVGRVLDKVYTIFSGIAASYGGYVDFKEGSEMVALFGNKVASGMELQQALRAGLEMLDRLHQINRYLSNRKIHIDIKVGVHSARLSVDQFGSLVGLEAVSAAKRLSQAATVGTVLVDRKTREAIGDVFVYESLGLIHLQGVSELRRAFRVVGVNPRGHGRRQRSMMVRRTQFVGRERLLAQLQEAYQHCIQVDDEGKWRRAEMGGKRYLPPSFIGLSGEIGTGKSRLLYEFGQRLGAMTESISRRIQGRADPLAHVPFGVFVSLIRVLSGIKPSDSPVVRRRKLESSLRPLNSYDASLECHGPVFGHLVGVKYDAPLLSACEPAALELQVQDAMVSLIGALAAHHFDTWSEPLVIYLKDLHWADDRSLQAIEAVVGALRLNVPLFIAATFHSEYVPPQGLRQTCFFQQFILGPLSTLEVSQLVDSMLPGFELPAKLSEQLQQLASGNPYYVEELVRNLVEKRVVVKDSNGWHLNDATAKVSLPESLSSLVLSRIDQLPRAVRDTLVCASVIGVIFPESLLRYMYSRLDRPNPEAHLKVLLEERLLRPVRAVRQSSFTFPNKVSREAIYGTLLPENRRLLHKLAAEGLLDLYSDHVGEHYGSLGFHFLEANETTKALRYLALAAEKAYRQNSLDLALGYMRLYVGQKVPGVPTLRMKLRFAHCLYRLGRFEEALEHLEALSESFSSAERDTALLGIEIQTRQELARVSEALGHGDKSVLHQGQALSLALRGNDSQLALQTRYDLVLNLFNQGRFHQALGVWQEVKEHAVGVESWQGAIASLGGRLRLQLGEPEAAVILFESALRHHIKMGSTDELFRDTCHLVEALLASGNSSEARLRLSEVLSKIDAPQNSSRFLQVVLLQRAALALDGGDSERAYLKQAVLACESRADAHCQAMGHRLLALVMQKNGQHESALWHEASAERILVPEVVPDAESA